LLKLLAIKLFGEFRIDAEIEKGTKIGFLVSSSSGRSGLLP
jgi:hypothetical protein